MTIKERVLEACIAVAQLNKHGHMTTYDVVMRLHSAGDFLFLRQVSNTMSKMTVWRKGLPRKTREEYLIRELKEHVWQEKVNPEDEIKDLRYKLRETTKQRDALQTKLDAAQNHNAQANDELLKIQRLWRALNNAMNPGR